MDPSKVVNRVLSKTSPGLASTTINRQPALSTTLAGEEYKSPDLAEEYPENFELEDNFAQDQNVQAPEPPVEEGESLPYLDEQMEQLDLEDDKVEYDISDKTEIQPNQQANSKLPLSIGDRFKGPKMAKVKAGYGEVKHFVGGLIEHPYEATKHFSILRHSHGLVFYKGPGTRIAITIFSDQPLPPDRKLWLQKRGYSGRTGLKVGALGTRSAWIDVTPTNSADPAQVPKDDERAWQRDISKFLRKAQDAKNIGNHQPWETDIVRIPHLQQDGYFRIVLCVRRKILCASPAFRYVPPSTDPSSIRGASLGTLPLELGVKLGAYITNNTISGTVQSAEGQVEQTAETEAENAVGL